MRDEATALVHYRMAVLGEDWVLANAVAESARLHGVWTPEMTLRTTHGDRLEPEVEHLIFLGIDTLREEVARCWAEEQEDDDEY